MRLRRLLDTRLLQPAAPQGSLLHLLPPPPLHATPGVASGCTCGGGSRRRFSAAHTRHRVAVEEPQPMTLTRAFQFMRLSKKNTDAASIKARYREMAKQLHPDAEGGSDAAFTELQSAYEVALEYLVILEGCFDNVDARSKDPAYNGSGRSSSSQSDHFDPNAHLYEQSTPQHRRYLNFEGVGYGSQQQRQAQYRIHKLERAMDRVSEYRANRLMDQAADDWVKERKEGGMTEDEEGELEQTRAAMRQQRQAKRKSTEPRKVEELIDAALQDWAAEAPTLSAFGRPFTQEELMMGSSTQDILTQRLNRVMKNAGYTPEWIVEEIAIKEGYDEAVRVLSLKWNSSREVHELFTQLHPQHPAPPDDHPLHLDYAGHFQPTPVTFSPHVYGDKWAGAVGDFMAEVKAINVRVVRFNLIVPIANKQRVLYSASNCVEHVQKYAPDLKLVGDDRVSQFSYGGVAGQVKVSKGMMLFLGLPVVGTMSFGVWLAARHKQLESSRAE